MKLPGFGKDLTFFVLLEQQADAAVRAAQEFHALTQDYARLSEYISRIDAIEHEADDFTHRLAINIDSTFVTPLDKEDLHAISTRLDDITDAVEDATHTLELYRLSSLHPGLEPLASLLVRVTGVTVEIVGALREMKGREAFQSQFSRIHDLEELSDDAYREALSQLYHAPDRDPFLFLAWKEVSDRIEAAVDGCEDVANVIESVLVKYA